MDLLVSMANLILSLRKCTQITMYLIYTIPQRNITIYIFCDLELNGPHQRVVRIVHL